MAKENVDHLEYRPARIMDAIQKLSKLEMTRHGSPMIVSVFSACKAMINAMVSEGEDVSPLTQGETTVLMMFLEHQLYDSCSPQAIKGLYEQGCGIMTNAIPMSDSMIFFDAKKSDTPDLDVFTSFTQED